MEKSRTRHGLGGRALGPGRQPVRAFTTTVVASLAAALIVSAAPAFAAKVVDVRVGQHAGYSRVVFELDAPVGYKVERNAPAAGVNELVVSLDAAAKAQTLRRKLDFIESVEIEPVASRRSTVRVRLKGDDLKLKEMILANPPRIVLDVLNEAAVAKARAAEKERARKALAAKKKKEEEAKKAEAKAAAAARAASAGTQAKAQARTQTKAANRAVQPPASSPKQKTSAGASQQLAMAPKNAAPPAPKPAARPAPQAARREARPPSPSAGGVPPSAAPKPNRAIARGTQVSPPANMPPKPGVTPPAARPAPKPAPLARPVSPTPQRPKATPPPAAMAQPSNEGFFNLTNIAVGAAGLVLLAGAGFVFMRRRNAAEVVDASAFENPLGDDNPFAGLDPEEGAEVEAETEEIAVSPEAQAEAGIEIPEADPIETATPVEEGTSMDMVSENAQTTIMDSPSVPPMGAAGGGDVSQMVAEFERRMKAMETRIDELVDAKERLERQVAAQTEELRVQRAAIARTQRAVRNLSRPGEDAPTEPALRDPSRPEGPRQ